MIIFCFQNKLLTDSLKLLTIKDIINFKFHTIQNERIVINNFKLI